MKLCLVFAIFCLFVRSSAYILPKNGQKGHTPPPWYDQAHRGPGPVRLPTTPHLIAGDVISENIPPQNHYLKTGDRCIETIQCPELEICLKGKCHIGYI